MKLSSARQALEGAALAPGNEATLRQLTDASRPLPPEVLNHVPPVAFDLDEDVFNRNLRSSKKGAAGGPSGMTCEQSVARCSWLAFVVPDLGENGSRSIAGGSH